jgi:hypothetical protein
MPEPALLAGVPRLGPMPYLSRQASPTAGFLLAIRPIVLPAGLPSGRPACTDQPSIDVTSTRCEETTSEDTGGGGAVAAPPPRHRCGASRPKCPEEV